MATLRSHEWFEPPSTSFGAAESTEALDRAKVRFDYARSDLCSA